MRILIAVTTLLFFNYSYSQNEGIFDESDGVTRIKVEIETDRKLGYLGTTSGKARRAYNKAVRLGQSDLPSAISHYLNAIEYDPYFVEAYDNVARLFRVIKDYDRAIEYYKKSLALFPEGVTAHQNLAVVYDRLKLYDKAIKEYEIIIDLTPNNPEGYYGLGTIYLDSAETIEDLEKALYYSESALELYKRNPPNYIGDGYFLIGYIHYFLGNTELSNENFEMAKIKYMENGMLSSWQRKQDLIDELK